MDIKSIIRDMLAKGLTREQILATLEEMGVSDAPQLFEEATSSVTEVSPPAEEPAAEGGEEAELPAAAPKPVSSTEAPVEGGKDVEAKLDEVLALLKALQEINKHILETDRGVLLRLRGKEDEAAGKD